MKHLLAWLSAREDRESSFYYYGSPVRLVQAWLCGGKTWSRRFINREGAVYVPEKRERADFRAVMAL